jgi:ATP-binding cassette subfamily C protein LapB
MQDAKGSRPLPPRAEQGRDGRVDAAAPRAFAEPEPVYDLLRLFAARVRGADLAEVALSRRFKPGALLSRESLAAAARELGFAVDFVPRDLDALTDADFPCLLLADDGVALIATGRQNETVLLAETNDGVRPARLASLAGRYSGLLLRLAPAIESADPMAPTDEAGAGAAAPADRSAALQLLDQVLNQQRPLLTQLVLATALSNSLVIVLPLFIMSVYDRVVPHFAMETLWALAIGVIISFAIDLGLRGSRATLLEAIAVNVGNTMQVQLYSRLMRLQLAATPRLAGSLAAALQELDSLARLVPQALVAVGVDLPFFVLMLVLLYYIGGAMVLAPLAGLVLITAANLAAYARSRRDNALSSRIYQQRANQLIESLSAIETVKALAAEPTLTQRWEALTDNAAFLGHNARHETHFAGNVALIAVQASIVMALVIGVYEVQAGAASVGALAAASLLVGRTMAPVGNLVALMVRGFHLLRTTEAIGAIGRAPVETAGDKRRAPAAAFAGAIALRNVGFGYGDGTARVLRDVSLTIEPGERVGLIGRIGCGKSTLLKLLPRYYEPTQGSLLVDGHDIRQLDPAFLRRHVALMPQEAVLFDLSLRDNIIFGLGGVAPAAFEEAVAISGVQDFASQHPEGYGMPVGPRGERLSGGERASVALARTLLRDPTLLLLDEPTANMDNELERRVVARLGDWLGIRTLILATHRAPLLSLVDRVIWLNAGQVVADGPRDEVLQRLKG